jgi:tetratricopeptide (TPR) repeat protein
VRILKGLVLFFWVVSAYAGGITSSDVAQILDDPDRINFTVPITYLRSFPDGPSDTLRIVLNITDPCVAEQLLTQETKGSPKTNIITPFTLTFPEIIGKSQSGNARCSVTKNRVESNKTLLVKFDTINTYKVRLGDDSQSIIIRVPLRGEPIATFVTPKFTVPSPPSTASAKELMASGKASMAAGEYEGATQTFNRLLNLPPNEYSQEAQELVGNARDKNGDFAKAKVEYELYVKLYPQTEGALRVNTRLAAINNGTAKVADNKFSTKKQINQVNQNTISGDISQSYFGSKTLSSETDAAGVLRQTRTTDASYLLTNIDISDRWRHNQYDDKFVIRDAQLHKFPPNSKLSDVNNLYQAYWDHDDKLLGYSIRLGRQTGSSQGLPNRFDGAFGRYTINDKFKITGSAGVIANGSHSQTLTNRHFYGTALEFGLPSSTVSGNVYAIQQVADNLTERRAVGTELRYFKDTTSWFGRIDYDTIYSALNTIYLQGYWIGSTEINYNLIVEHSKSPPLLAEGAISALTFTAPISPISPLSVSGVRKVLTTQQIFDVVKYTTPEFDSIYFGGTKQVTPKRNFGGDVRLSRTQGTRGIDLTPFGVDAKADPTSGTGISYAYALHAIGNNVVFADDTTRVDVGYEDNPHSYAQTLVLVNSATFRTKWLVSSSLSLVHLKGDSSLADQKTFEISPTVRVSYSLLQSTSLDAELSFRKLYQDDSTGLKTRSSSESIFIGYRWDF